MTVTNKLNLPMAFVKAVSVERHNKHGSYSATTLNKGTKEIILQERHWDEMTVDAADSVWATFGTAVHAIMEKYEDGNFHEEKFEIPVSKSKVTGTVDSYDMKHAVINDWKTASVYKIMKEDFSDWYAQGMTYAWLLIQNGLEVRYCRFIALLKDHSMTKAATDSNYPQSPVFIYEFDVTPEELEATGKRIEAKIKDIEKAELLGDDDIEPCNEDERWQDKPVFAVMKEGRKSAIKLFDNEADCKAMVEELGAKHYVQYRPGVARKCENYCLCKEWCHFYRAMKEEQHDE